MAITNQKNRLFSKSAIALSLSVLAACSHTVTMYPRWGGDVVTGSLNDGTREIQLMVKGKQYTGKFVRNQTSSFGVGQTFGASQSGLAMKSGFGTTALIGASNQATAVLVSGSDVLRCELVVVNASDGNGVCIDQDDVTYDVLIK